MPLKDTEGGGGGTFLALKSVLWQNANHLHIIWTASFTSFSSHEMIELTPAGWGYEVD